MTKNMTNAAPKINENIAEFSDFQNRKLNQKIDKLEERNKRLIATAIGNIESTKKINELTLTLLSSENKEEMMYYFKEVVINELKLDSANLILKTEETVSYEDLCVNVFKEEQKVCLRTASEKSPCLHEAKNICIRSEALLKLENSRKEDMGILTLGSADVQRFHEGQGCDLLEFLGGIISYKLETFIQKSA